MFRKFYISNRLPSRFFPKIVVGYTVYCPLPHKGYLLGCFVKIFYHTLPHLTPLSKEIELTTNIVKDAIANYPQFSHMKESHYFIAQFNMMGLNIAPICNVTA